MCGIFGFYLKDKKIKNDQKEEAIKTLDLLKHRGPDNFNFWINEENNFFLGHTRLSIIDKSNKSHQPFVANQTALSFNGEIYNYRKLRKDLEKDFKFNSTGDTEVLFNYLKKNKIQNLDNIDGMFAFAYYNNGELFLCTDIFGEKPLYYISNEKGLFFSSEIKPLQKFLKIKKDFSEDKKNKFLTMGFLREDTFFKNLYYSPPASIIKVKNGTIVEKKKYWNYQSLLSEKNKKKIIEPRDIIEVKNILVDSCNDRLNSDQPLSLLLSSGIDSTLLASIYKKELNKNIECFHASFQNINNTASQINETPIAKEIAKHLKLDLFIKKVDIDLNYFNCSNLFEIFSQPNDNISSLLLDKLNKLVSEKYKVAISGLGADEIFYGYNGYHFFNKNLRFIKSSLFSNILKLFNIFNFKKLKTFSYYNKFRKLDLIFSHLNYKFQNELKKKNYDNLIFDKNFSFINNYSIVRFTSSLPYQMLTASDLASMKHSLEIRSPYLNKKLLLKILEFDPSSFIQYGQKYLQKSILKNYLPIELINKKKIGFVLKPNSFNSTASAGHKEKSKSIENSYGNIDRLYLRESIYNNFFTGQN